MNKLIAAVLAFFAFSAFAESPAVSTVTTEQKIAVKELLDAMNYKQMMSQMTSALSAQMPQMIDQMTTSMLDGAGEKMKADARQSMSAEMAKFTKKSMEIYSDPEILDGIEGVMTRMYLKYFTVEEIRATTAFYVSPAGRKALSVMPKMMQETMPEMMSIIAPKMNALAQDFARDIVKEAKKKETTGAAK